MEIKPVATNVGDALRTSFYKIPRFQRPYSWDKEHIEDFWHDTVESDDDEYFIGSMVFYRNGAGIVSIVDGQQRITTITLMLCAIRNSFKKNSLVALAGGIHQLIQRSDINNKLESVLKTETSYPYLQEYILKNGPPEIEVIPGEEERSLRDSFRYIEAKLDDQLEKMLHRGSLNGAQRKQAIQERLKQIRDKILDLKMISITLDSEDDAYLIFETLNTRGQELEISHLVKSHLTRLLPSTTADTDPAKDRWNKLVRQFDQLESDASINSYLHHSWLASNEYVTEKQLFKAMRTHIIKRNQARAYLDALVGESGHYRRIFDPDEFDWRNEEAKVRGSLRALGIFHVRQAAPFVFALLREYYADRLKLRQLRKTLRAIENFHFISTAISSRHSSGGISMMYASAARTLTKTKTPQDREKHLQEFREKISEKLPLFEVFEADFGELSYLERSTKQKSLVRYILNEVDNHLRADKVVDYSRMTIEHLSPQNPGPLALVPPDDVGRIGNLILVSPELNDTLGNKSFSEKKKLLRDARFPLDRALKRAKKWTAVEIKSRTHALAELGYKEIWKI